LQACPIRLVQGVRQAALDSGNDGYILVLWL